MTAVAYFSMLQYARAGRLRAGRSAPSTNISELPARREGAGGVRAEDAKSFAESRWRVRLVP